MSMKISSDALVTSYWVQIMVTLLIENMGETNSIETSGRNILYCKYSDAVFGNFVGCIGE